MDLYFVTNKTMTCKVVAELRSKKWLTVTHLLSIGDAPEQEIRAVLDTLHYAGIVRTRDLPRTRDLEYQWC